MDYTLVDSDDALLELVGRLEEKERIAVDFEGEFNLHIYGEHLCLVQIYDGEGFFLIDPRSSRITQNGLGALFSSSVEKVWFDVQSDASLVYKSYGLRINNVYDLRALALALGDTGNLVSIEEKYLGLHAGAGKKKKQTSNWLTRPVSAENIGYALSDVAHLLDLKTALEEAVRREHLEAQAEGLLRKAVQMRKPSLPWTKLPGWRDMSREERVYAKHFFLARDKVAKRFNVPAVRVMDKRRLVEVAKRPPEKLEAALSGENPRYSRFLLDAMEKAEKKAREELSGD